VAEALGSQPGELRLLSMGRVNDNDSLQLCDARTGYSAKLAFNVLKVKLNLHHVSSQPPHVQELVKTTSPNVVMGSNPTLMRMIIYLLDQPPNRTGVHAKAYDVLARLQTFPDIVNSLKAAGAPFSGEGLPACVHSILCIPVAGAPVAQKRPGALLYALEALYALMRPATTHTQGSLSLRHPPLARYCMAGCNAEAIRT
jgi:hypothetical protein